MYFIHGATEIIEDWLRPPRLLMKERVNVMVCDVRHREEGRYTLKANLFLSELHDDDCSFVDLIAYKHQARRMNPCEDTLPADVKEFEFWFQDHIGVFSMDCWRNKLPKDDISRTKICLESCRFCPYSTGRMQPQRVFMAILRMGNANAIT